jgi:uncharacterized protein (DUF1684 family)
LTIFNDKQSQYCCIIAVIARLMSNLINFKNIFSFFVITTLLWSCSSSNVSKYTGEILQERIKKDAEFRHPEDSPLKEKSERDAFSGLKYFDVDEDFKVMSFINKSASADTVYLKTSTDDLRAYLVYGTAEFQLNGIDCKLKIYKGLRHVNHPVYSKILLVPFLDETSGNLSYGGGRYLEVETPASDSLELDFNNAFNPYCHYTSGYSCTKVPEDNTLALEVLAGEMKYGDSHH